MRRRSIRRPRAAPAVTDTCASGRSTLSGAGGHGGTMDTNCGIFSLDYNARAGTDGANASYVAGGFGLHGNGGSGGGVCGPTTNGNPGAVTNGAAGTGGSGGYLGGASSLYWYAPGGSVGGTGDN